MENFCKGMLWGVVVGACIGAVVVAKNKKLSKKLKDGIEITEDKLKETKQALEEKLNQEESCFCSCDEKSQNNNFSKKNKNC